MLVVEVKPSGDRLVHFVSAWPTTKERRLQDGDANRVGVHPASASPGHRMMAVKAREFAAAAVARDRAAASCIVEQEPRRQVDVVAEAVGPDRRIGARRGVDEHVSGGTRAGPPPADTRRTSMHQELRDHCKPDGSLGDESSFSNSVPPLRRIVCRAAARLDVAPDHVLAEVVVDDVAAVLLDEPDPLLGAFRRGTSRTSRGTPPLPPKRACRRAALAPPRCRHRRAGRRAPALRSTRPPWPDRGQQPGRALRARSRSARARETRPRFR